MTESERNELIRFIESIKFDTKGKEIMEQIQKEYEEA